MFPQLKPMLYETFKIVNGRKTFANDISSASVEMTRNECETENEAKLSWHIVGNWPTVNYAYIFTASNDQIAEISLLTRYFMTCVAFIAIKP